MMFLKKLIRRNRRFLESVIHLHQECAVPANSYVLDLDSMQANARLMSSEAQSLGLKLFAITKQIGRVLPAMQALEAGGIKQYVAVDMHCARPIHAAGYNLAHIGHLVQVARAEARAAAAMDPDYWTVFCHQKAAEADSASAAAGRSQKLLARIHAEGDTFYSGHEGGFCASEIVEVADALDELSHAEFAGITTFPALLYNPEEQRIDPTPNLRTLETAAENLVCSGRKDIEINAPGTTSTITMEALASAGATQVEPGHGLTGTTPLHAVRDLPEIPAMLYLSEISHFYNGHPYCFGGGMYIDPVFPPYQVRACVGKDPDSAPGHLVNATLPSPSAIDYYGILEVDDHGLAVEVGDSVIFGFRVQAFFTRAFVVPVSGISSGQPKVEGIWTSNGKCIQWPAWPDAVEMDTRKSRRSI